MGYIEVSSDAMRLSLSNLMEPRIKIDIYNENADQYIDTITGGITGGSLSINSESDIRWTFSLNVIPNKDFDVRIKENNYIWVDKYIKLYLGMYSPVRTLKEQLYYYPMGKYFPISASITYDATNNQLSISCSDPVSNYNGNRNGQFGALNTIFPAYYDTKYYAVATYTDNIYSATISDYKENEYVTGDIFCLKLPESNQEGCKIKINSLDALPVYQAIVGYDIQLGELSGDTEYLFQVMYNARTNVKYFTMVGELEEINIIDEGAKDEVTYYLTYHRIRDAVITVLKQLARIKEDDYFVDEIGEYKAMPGYTGYEEYREATPLWDTIPYDQEFGVGSSIWQIITQFTGLYPNYEAYFNAEGILKIGMKPDCTNDLISLYNDYMKKIYISENTSVDLSTVRNVNLVYGKSIETDFFADTGVTFADNTYSAKINSYEKKYYNGDKVALRIPEGNTGEFFININGFGKLPVWDDNLEEVITDPVLESDTIYVFKIYIKRENKKNVKRAYLLGHWQAEGLCALVNGATNEETYTTFNGDVVPVYSREYFMDVYNCENVVLVALPDSPFTCEKLGVRLNVHSGGEFENIDSNSDAMERAKWETYKSARLTDTISLTTKLVPFVNDVNIKVQYQPINEELAHEYLVTSISHDFYGGLTTWTLVRFYDYYIPEGLADGYTWAVVTAYNWTEMYENFTWQSVLES